MTTIRQHHLPACLSPALTVREAITDAVTRFLVGLDTPDKHLFESAFIKSATLSVNGNVFEGLSSIMTGCYDLIGKLDTTHFLTNVRINVEACGKKAGVTASALSQHYRPGEGLQGGGKDALVMGSLYWVELVRDEGEEEFWRIQHLTLRSAWADGEWWILKG
ncbi:SnoaL-like domain-containing protein [Aspergillus granulosus]|uniref:SnoaL-like domain-containing protein n=1 Tax=Aspergillus granulosus TaxID=176169 RepID=A0ABR4HAP1_9EURO